MHFHWQATPLSPGLSLATNLCPLLSFSSIPHSPFFFQSPKWRILQTLPSFALSIFLALVSECLHCLTVSCNLIRNNSFPLFWTALLSRSLTRSVKRDYSIHQPWTLHAQLSHFLLQIGFHILFSSTLCCFHPFYLFPVFFLCFFLTGRYTDLTHCPSWSAAFISSCSARSQDALQINQLHPKSQ